MNLTLKKCLLFLFFRPEVFLNLSFLGVLSPTYLIGAAIQLTREYCELKMKRKDTMNHKGNNPWHSGLCHLEVMVDKEMKDLVGFVQEVA